MIWLSHIAIFGILFWLVFRNRPVWAFLGNLVQLAMIFKALCFVPGYEYHEEAAVLSVAVTIVIFFVINLLLAVLPPAPGKSRWPGQLARVLLILSFWGSLILLFILTLKLFILWILGLIIFASMEREYRKQCRYQLILEIMGMIRGAIRQQLPLAETLESAIDGTNRHRDRILGNIGLWLKQGYSVSKAIEFGYPQCPDQVVGMLRVGDHSGQIEKAIDIVFRDLDAERDLNNQQKVPFSYFFCVMVTNVALTFSYAVFILPKMQTIFEDLSQKLEPSPVFGVFDFIIQFWAWIVIAVVAALQFVGFMRLYRRFRKSGSARPPLLIRLQDTCKWFLPVMHRIERDRAVTVVAAALRTALSAGRTLIDAIADSLDLDINACYRARLERWRHRVEAGEPIDQSAIACQLGKDVAWALNTELHPEDQLNYLQTLEETARNRYLFTVRMAHQIAKPILTIALGVMTGFFAYVIVFPMAGMINVLITHITP